MYIDTDDYVKFTFFASTQPIQYVVQVKLARQQPVPVSKCYDAYVYKWLARRVSARRTIRKHMQKAIVRLHRLRFFVKLNPLLHKYKVSLQVKEISQQLPSLT
jgi:hypothetical protein